MFHDDVNAVFIVFNRSEIVFIESEMNSLCALTKNRCADHLHGVVVDFFSSFHHFVVGNGDITIFYNSISCWPFEMHHVL